jgi:hypothetical protein
MNWLDRARREIQESAQRSTANTDEGNLVAVTAVLYPILQEKSGVSMYNNGGAKPVRILEPGAVWEDFEERAAILEFDGGLNREGAEDAAWALIVKKYSLH